MRYIASRPLLIAIGPSAVAAVEEREGDLDIVDVLAVDGSMEQHELDVWVTSGFFARTLTSCIFDARDVAWRETATRVTRAASLEAELPVWFICTSVQSSGEARRIQLRRLAAHLDVCVIDALASPPVRVALCVSRALHVPGPLACHPHDMRVVAHAQAIGTFVEGLPDSVASDTSSAFLSIGCANETTLFEINEICGQMGSLLPEDANLLVAAPHASHCSVSSVLFTR